MSAFPITVWLDDETQDRLRRVVILGPLIGRQNETATLALEQGLKLLEHQKTEEMGHEAVAIVLKQAWRSRPLLDEVGYDWGGAIEKLQEHYPGRFNTFGELFDATDAELLAPPGLGRKRVAYLREIAEMAMRGAFG